MNSDFLELLQVILIIIICISFIVIMHNVAVAFDTVKSWYLLLVCAAGYYVIEEKLNP